MPAPGVPHIHFKLVDTTGRPAAHQAWAAGDPVQLYDLRADPGERVNRADDPAMAQRLADLRAARAAMHAGFPPVGGVIDATVDDGVQEALEALGYLVDERR